MSRALRTYAGRCHCGAVRFEIDTDFPELTTCDGSMCRGIYPFHRKRVTPDYYGVNVHCLDDFDADGIPVRRAVGAAMP